MVLESLVGPGEAQRSPWKIVLLAFGFASIASYVSLYWTGENAGLVVVALASLAAIPFVYNLFNYDESAFEEGDTVLGSGFLARHFPVIIVLMALFVGLVAGFTAWYLYLPVDQSNRLFDVQLSEIKAVKSAFQGKAIVFTDSVAQAFEAIFLHNLQVLFLIIVLSLLYSSGSVIVLSWNAAVIGVFLGSLAKEFSHTMDEPSILTGLSIGVLGIIPHGSFELAAYSTAALAGGVLSSAIIRREHVQTGFVVVVYDIAKLLALATILLTVGAGIESQAFA